MRRLLRPAYLPARRGLRLFTPFVRLGIEKARQSPIETTNIRELALPEDQYAPTRSAKAPHSRAIARFVPSDFLLPERDIRCREGSSPTACVSMPEATVDKYDFPMAREDDVGLAWKIATVQPESVAKGLDQCLHPTKMLPTQPRRLVLGANGDTLGRGKIGRAE